MEKNNKTVLFIAPKDNALYNFRSELVLAIKERYRVVLLCPYGKKIDYFIERGCEFIAVNIDRKSRNPLKELALLSTYKKVIRKVNPDIVLTFTTKASIWGGMACRLTGCRYIVNNSGLLDTKDNPILGFILRFLYRFGYNGAQSMMYQNSSEMAFFQKILRKGMPYHVLPGSGVNIDAFKFQPYPEERDEIVFNFVGRLLKDKGIEEFLDCADLVKAHYPKVRFIIYGGYDTDNDMYKARLDSSVASNIVEYAGEQMDMRPFIASADAAIHPSYHEGMTNVILEHGAMGRPSLASNIPGCKEGIDDGVSGLLFECKNVDDMVAKVEAFINMPYEARRLMGQAARAKMEKDFDRRIVTNTYLEVIARIIGD